MLEPFAVRIYIKGRGGCIAFVFDIEASGNGHGGYEFSEVLFDEGTSSSRKPSGRSVIGQKGLRFDVAPDRMLHVIRIVWPSGRTLLSNTRKLVRLGSKGVTRKVIVEGMTICCV